MSLFESELSSSLAECYRSMFSGCILEQRGSIVHYCRILLCYFVLQDAIINGVIAVFFFGGAVALGVRSGDWRFWLSQGNDEEIRATRINHIAASAAAASVSESV